MNFTGNKGSGLPEIKDWSSRTLSAMFRQSSDLVKTFMNAHPQAALLSEEACQYDRDAYLLHSYEGYESDVGFSALQKRVLNRFPDEIHCTSAGEESLLRKLVLANGDLFLNLWEDGAAAEKLLNRLWIGYENVENRVMIHLPQKLLAIAEKELCTKKHAFLRKRTDQFDTLANAYLYLNGCMNEKPLLEALMQYLEGFESQQRLLFARRYLKSSYFAMPNDEGSMTLFHVAFADFEPYINVPEQTLPLIPPKLFDGAIQGILPEEEEAHTMLCRAIASALREDLVAEEVAEDLRFLVKQGISYKELLNVLENQLIVYPTDAMKRALSELYRCTLRWPMFQPELLN